MASLRPAKCYRRIKRAYTRKSKFKKKGYVKAVPNPKITKYNIGNQKGDYKYRIDLLSKNTIQLRHNAIESVRQSINRHMQKLFGPQGYYLVVRLYPHHALRENKMLSGAGADRMQTGMSHAFGKVISLAAQLKPNKEIFTVYVPNKPEVVRGIFQKMASKLPCKIAVNISTIK